MKILEIIFRILTGICIVIMIFATLAFIFQTQIYETKEYIMGIIIYLIIALIFYAAAKSIKRWRVKHG